MKKKEDEISLSFVSDIKYTEFCVLVFSYIKNVLHIKDDEFFKIEISLREVINNAIIHGNKSDINKKVHVKFRWNKTHILINIKDENPEHVDFEAINAKLEENDLLSFNGRGILIMKSYMDKVEFLPSNQGTEILLEKKL
ncbi:MAG: ATP-binding protein [bacterium]|nr:ATP-binding protein [bacterium]